MTRNAHSPGLFASNADLGLAAGYVVLVTAVLALVGDLPTAVAVPLALPVFLLAPGYAVVTAISPATAAPASAQTPGDRLGARETHDGLTRLERLTLSVVASVAVVPLVAFVVNFVVGVSLVPVLGGVAAVTVLAALVGARRRSPVELAGRAGNRSLLAGVPTDGITLACAAVAALMLVGGAAMAVTDDPSADTEFYLVTETADGEYEASGYPTDLAAGATAEYTFAIEQHGAEPREYTVVAQLEDRSGSGANATVSERRELDRFSTTVAPGEPTVETHAVSPTMTGDLTLTFLLYEGDAPENPDRASAHRVVHLPVEVS